jgi:hypothetical protein
MEERERREGAREVDYSRGPRLCVAAYGSREQVVELTGNGGSSEQAACSVAIT